VFLHCCWPRAALSRPVIRAAETRRTHFEPGLPPGRVYRICESQSELRILVYRRSLAHFGHNHVMVNHAIRGASAWRRAERVRVSADCAGRRLVVDDPRRAARRERILPATFRTTRNQEPCTIC